MATVIYTGYFHPATYSGAPPPCDCACPVLIWTEVPRAPDLGLVVFECAGCRCTYAYVDVARGNRIFAMKNEYDEYTAVEG